MPGLAGHPAQGSARKNPRRERPSLLTTTSREPTGLPDADGYGPALGPTNGVRFKSIASGSTFNCQIRFRMIAYFYLVARR